LVKYIIAAAQKAEILIERLTPEETAKLVSRLRGKKQLAEVRGEISLAIDRLQELQKRLNGPYCPLASPDTPAGAQERAPNTTKRSAAPMSPKTPGSPGHVYSVAMRCPKCQASTRFRRAADADPKVDSWMCTATGCQIRISHVVLKVDRNYSPGPVGIDNAPPPREERVRCPECDESFPNNKALEIHKSRVHFSLAHEA
jgi:hypothetical protein